MLYVHGCLEQSHSIWNVVLIQGLLGNRVCVRYLFFVRVDNLLLCGLLDISLSGSFVLGASVLRNRLVWVRGLRGGHINLYLTKTSY